MKIRVSLKYFVNGCSSCFEIFSLKAISDYLRKNGYFFQASVLVFMGHIRQNFQNIFCLLMLTKTPYVNREDVSDFLHVLEDQSPRK